MPETGIRGRSNDVMVNFSKHFKALLHSASGHQGNHMAHQACNAVFYISFRRACYA